MAEFIGQAWLAFANNLQKDYEQKESKESELSFLFFNLTKWLEKKSSLYWHTRTFQEYIREDLNPLGLRVQIFPSFDNIDSTFKMAWENVLKSCSNQMMNLLIEEYKKRLIDIDRNIDKLYSQINTLNTHPSFPELNEKLKAHIEAFNRDILAKKENKFLRDKQAFQEGRAYKWHQQSNTRNRQSRYKQNDYQSDASDTSSVASNVSHSFPKTNRHTKKQKRQRDGDSSEGRPKRNQRTRTYKTPIKKSTLPDNTPGPNPAGSITKEIPSTTIKIPSLFQPKNLNTPSTIPT